MIRRQTRDSRTSSVESSVYSSKWTTVKSDFRTAAKAFYNQTAEYRQTQVYRSFLHLRFDETSSTFTNSIDDTSERESYITSNVSRISRRHQNVDDTLITRQRSKFDETVFTSSVSSLTDSEASINANNNSVDIDFDVTDSTNTRQTSNSQESSTTTEKIVRNDFDMSDQSTFSDQQRTELREMITSVVTSVIRETVTSASNDDDDDDEEEDDDLSSVDVNLSQSDNASDWKSKDIGFFDSKYEKSAHIDDSIVNADRYVFYRDVYVFIDRLKNMTSLREKNKLRIVISQCLRGTALIWHSAKLSDFEKNLLRNRATLINWYDALIVRFKKRASETLEKLQRLRYIMTDARNARNSRLYAQKIFRHARSIELDSVFNQLIMTWSNLDWKFRQHVSESNSDVTIRQFLEELNKRVEVWYDMIKHFDRSQFRSQSFDNNNSRKSNSDSNNSKQNSRSDRVDDRTDDYYIYQSTSQQFRLDNLSYQNRAYQNNQQSSDRQSQRALSFERQSLQIIDENASDSRKNQKFSRNAERFADNNRSDDNNNARQKSRVYVVDEENENETIEKSTDFNNNQDAFYSQNLNYYDSNYEFDDSENDILATHFVISTSAIECRRCHKTFEFNNQLHVHLRIDCQTELRKTFTALVVEVSSTAVIKAFSMSIVIETSANSLSKISASLVRSKSADLIKTSVISSNVDVFKDLDIDFEFRDWSYVKENVSLIENEEKSDVCFDTDVNVTLIDAVFFHRQNSDVSIRQMITSLTMRDLDTSQHQSSDYAIVSMYFVDVKNDSSVKALIRREIHLVDNLKINMLIDNDVTVSEDVVLDLVKKQALIDSCDVTIALDVRSRASHAQQRSIHVKKIIVLSSRNQMTIFIHHLVDELLVSRDFLFESDESNLILYAHIIDVDIKVVLTTNDSNSAVKISRNFRLDRLIELDFSQAYHLDEDEDVVELTRRRSKSEHKIFWFKKFIAVVVVVSVAVTAVIKTSANSLSKISVLLVKSKSADLTLPETRSIAVVYAVESFILELQKSSLVSVSEIDAIDTDGKSFAVSSSEIILSNDVTIHQSDVTQSFVSIVDEFFALWENIDFVELSQDNWMRISLKFDWKSRIISKVKIYSLDQRDRNLVDKTFDELHEQDRLSWITDSTLFSYSAFVVWKNVDDEKKNRVVMNIRELNAITQSDVYSLSLQTDIISVVRNCSFISIVDASAFFYQWRVHSNDRHKLTVVTHRDQKFFNVIVMNYKNSSTYVQRQIDRLLRKFRRFARTYVDDIVIYFRIVEKHAQHLRSVFDMLRQNNISIKSSKTFLDYSSVRLLDQKIDSFELSISEKKLRAIAKFSFSKILRQLEIYLGLIDWLRDYVSFYVDVFKTLQKRKTELLKSFLKTDNARKTYSSRTRLENASSLKIEFFRILQFLLFKLSYLVHHDSKRQTFVDLDVSKKFELDVMIYHVKSFANWNDIDYSSRKSIELILFFSRLLISVETRYWSTELKLTDIVWVLKKIRHFIDSFALSIVIYTDHDSTLEIVKQISLTISSTDKFNFRLVRASNYIQRFNLDIRHKSDKQHIVSDALSRLVSLNDSIKKSFDESELNALFITTLIEMKKVFRNRLLKDYTQNSVWKKIIVLLNAQKQIDTENSAALPFYRENDLIFRTDDHTSDHAFQSRRLCISQSLVGEILDTFHDVANDHFDFTKCYERVAVSYFIRDLFKQLRDYLRHCSNCQIHQIRRHKSYDFLQSILSTSILFHILIIDFILDLLKSREEFDVAMSVICKFFKRIICVLGKFTWTITQWVKTLLNRLDVVDWSISKVIISNRDRKFMFELWIELFRQLDVKLLYSTAYHSQTDDQSERINQTLKIALRFAMIMLNNSTDWSNIVSRIQRILNNFIVSIDKTLNETFYDFTSTHSENLLSKSLADVALISSSTVYRSTQRIVRFEIVDVIAFAQMHAKYYYDKDHASIFMKTDEWALLRLHKDYKISITARLSKKYAQQYVDSFQITERIERLVYRLVISINWRVHNVFTIAQLKSCSSFDDDSYCRFKSTESNSVFVEDDIDQVKSWKLNRLMDKRTSQREIEYLVRWKDWSSKHDVWRSLSELDNVMNLINDYEIGLTRNFELQKSFVVFTSSSSVSQSPSDQRFAVVISQKLKTTSSLTPDIEALTLTRKSVAIFSSSTDQIARRSSTDQIARRSDRLTKRS